MIEFSLPGHCLVSLCMPRSRLRRCQPHRSTALVSSPLPSCPRDLSLTCTCGRSGRGCACPGSQTASLWCRRSCGHAEPPPDVTNGIESADFDSVGIAAGRRCASLMRSSTARPRSAARVPCILAYLGDPALAVPCACSRFQQQRQRQQRLCQGRGCGHQWDTRSAACA